MHLDVFGIFFLIGYVVSKDATRLYFEWKRDREEQRRLDALLERFEEVSE